MRSHTQRLMVCAASFAALCMGLAGCGSDTASSGGDSGEVVNLRTCIVFRIPKA